MAYVPVHAPSPYPRSGGGDQTFSSILGAMLQAKIARQEQAAAEASAAELAELQRGLGTSADDLAIYADRLYDAGRFDEAHKVMGMSINRAGVDARYAATAQETAALEFRRAQAERERTALPEAPAWGSDEWLGQAHPERIAEFRARKQMLEGMSTQDLEAQLLQDDSPEGDARRREMARRQRQMDPASERRQAQTGRDIRPWMSQAGLDSLARTGQPCRGFNTEQCRQLFDAAVSMQHPCAEIFQPGSAGADEAAASIHRSYLALQRESKPEEAADLAKSFEAALGPQLQFATANRYRALMGLRVHSNPCAAQDTGPGMSPNMTPTGPPEGTIYPQPAPPTDRRPDAPAGTEPLDALQRGVMGVEFVGTAADPGQTPAGGGTGLDAAERLRQIAERYPWVRPQR